MREIFEVAGAILLSIGGAGTVIFGLSSFLGKMWASRILEEEKALYSEQLEKLKHGLNLQAHSVNQIFDAEFGIYQDLWRHANDIRSVAINLRSGLRKSSLSEDEAKSRHGAFKDQLWQFEHYVE
ncbi:MAG: hypothetical protein HOP17_17780, partial [Acidobacteria bacterium]|nr:hypothetical protein [Acidobacteriota bacterium]